MILRRIFGRQKTGFYVDLGAHHPKRFSNTYSFYLQGWRGINVDALPGTKKLFDRIRPRDVTVECGVGMQQGMLKYFAFNEPALNTFSEQEARIKSIYPYYIVDTFEVPVTTLKQILDDQMPRNIQIDFMTIDVEGFDHEVISSNDWYRYRPGVVLVELLNTDIADIESHPTAQMLKINNYRPFAKTCKTYFFVANEAKLQNI